MQSAATNGHPGPSGNAKMRRLLALYEEQETTARENADALRKVLGLLGDSAVESAQRRASATINGALKLESARRGEYRPHISDEELERRSNIVRHFLARQPLSSMRAVMGELKHRGIELTTDQTRLLLTTKLKSEVERVGDRTAARYRLRNARALQVPKVKAKGKAKKAKSQIKDPHKRPSSSFNGTTAEKARIIATIIRDNGGVLNTKELVKLARPAGISSLTGMVNYIRAGWLKRTRDRKGDSAYRFVSMPPDETPEPAAES